MTEDQAPESLPASCQLGIPLTAIADHYPPGTFAAFLEWMTGQTMATCDGREFNHDTGTYEPSNCGPHGTVVYSRDLRRFLAGLPVDD